jgi:hypothetical protein
MDKFKDTLGKWITTGLFHELSQSRHNIIWTLAEARKKYLDTEDPTGYTFATEHLGGWDHWQAIKNSPTLEAHIAKWEEEMEVRIRSQGLKRIMVHSKGDKGYQAAKYLVEAQWIKNEKGRPTKEKVDREARIRSKLYDEFDTAVTEYKQ